MLWFSRIGGPMIRSLLVIAVSLLLAGCWTSDQRFFDTGDWAHLDLSGEYEVAAIADGDGPRRATLVSRPDGLIELTPVPQGEDMPTLMGLVPIAGGSGHFFLAVDRTNAGDDETYYIAELSDEGGLAFYFPECDGTSPIEGMTKAPLFVLEEANEDGDTPTLDQAPVIHNAEASSPNGSTGNQVCKFLTRDALMAAGLEAEHFLSAHHVVAVTPFLAFSKRDGDSSD